MQDVVSFSKKHNFDNGEGNHDGHHDNCSDNMGVEGISDDPAVVVARVLRKRAMLATLFLAQGTPMLLAGDELGHSQRGNNNAYAQDTDVSWLSWDAAPPQPRCPSPIHAYRAGRRCCAPGRPTSPARR